LMGYKPLVDICNAWLYVQFVHPWHGDELVIANANPHAMKILFLFALPMVLQGMDSRTNHFQERENDAIQIASRPSIHELQRIELCTRMKIRRLILVPRRRLHALHGHIRTLKELPVVQHHAWMIV